ncbi:cell filamentation protein Fic [bacterium endosymbiont of Escarpia laminata]|nr:MAG: cell filamentation protein Fic [bacterium endosymbiont of Escarpia laminata]
MSYQPPYTLTDEIISLVAEIGDLLGAIRLQLSEESALRLRRINRIRTVTGSLAIEGNTLSEQQVTAILDGKRVIAPPREVREASNALAAYEQMADWNPLQESDLLTAHRVMMLGLIDSAGIYRQGGVGIMAGDEVQHIAPPPSQVARLMTDLFQWAASTNAHALIASSVFHYEFEFIHPFADGNGRMGRLWQTLLLSRWQPLFSDIPVESLIHDHQADYYQALQQATAQTDCAPFILFMLMMIRDGLSVSSIDQVTDQVTDQVKNLLAVMGDGYLSAKELMERLSLSHRPTFRDNYLTPALQQGLVEMRDPDSPRSPRQKYRKK